MPTRELPAAKVSTTPGGTGAAVLCIAAKERRKEKKEEIGRQINFEIDGGRRPDRTEF